MLYKVIAKVMKQVIWRYC